MADRDDVLVRSEPFADEGRHLLDYEVVGLVEGNDCSVGRPTKTGCIANIIDQLAGLGPGREKERTRGLAAAALTDAASAAHQALLR